MSKTIAELIAEGKSVDEISKMAQAEADAVAATKDKRKIDPEEVNAVREYLRSLICWIMWKLYWN